MDNSVKRPPDGAHAYLDEQSGAARGAGAGVPSGGGEEALRRLNKATIMMVDDEPINMEVVQAFLENAGYGNFITTERSTEALAIVSDRRPDVLLLDLEMPGVTGFEILERMAHREDLKHIPVIVLTASDDAATKLRVLELGATDFLGKPVDPSELVLRLRNTLAAKAYQDQLAYYDGLTGLPNRRMFLENLDWAIRRAKRDKGAIAILNVGLDRFRQINETLGHQVGDALLSEIARRIKTTVRESDCVGVAALEDGWGITSRVTGDEFAIMLGGLDRAEHAVNVAQRVLAAVEEPFQVAANELVVKLSIGIASFPSDGEETDVLLKNAATALHQAKRAGGGSYKFYSSEMNAKSTRRLTLESRLRKAIAQDEMQLYYQPKVAVRTATIKGVEALIRWHNDELGMVSPAEFIPLAEESDLITAIGDWVLRTAVRQVKAWQEEGMAPLTVAVNISGRQFHHGGLAQTVEDVLQSLGIAPGLLELEITESVVMQDTANTIETLNVLKDIGVSLAIDDFGTGYSSLSYLKRFPLDTLKIDRSFVKDLPGDQDDAAITSAIIAIAKTLGYKVVAEGVETKEQLRFLQQRGCDEIQGFLFCKPLAAAVLTERMRRFNERQRVAAKAPRAEP